MKRSRAVPIFVVSLLCVVLAAGAAWCGGPPTERRPDRDQSQQPGPSTPGPSAPSAAPAGGGFSVAQSAAPGGTVGANSKSPWVRLEEVGIHNTAILSTRVAYDGGSIGGVYFRVMGDYIWARFRGSQNYTGLPIPEIPFVTTNAEVNSRLDMNIFALTGDADLLPFLTPGSAVRFGPRLQLVSYSDLFRVEPLGGGGQFHEGSLVHAGTMIGFGGFGMLDLGALFGFGAQTSFGSLFPVINAAVTYGGRSSQMRYSAWEATIRLFKSGNVSAAASDGIIGSLSAPALMFEVGYAQYQLKQGLDTIEHPFTAQPGRDTNLNLRVTVPIIRGTLAF